MSILEIRQLSKSFGTHHVLKNVNLEIPEHSIFGFVGINGAGKTTTMKIILGLSKSDGGSVSVAGEKVQYGDTKTNRFIGYLPDVPEFYNYMRPMEYLKLCGEITGLSASQTKTKSEELLVLVGLAGEKKKIGGFSRGMKQRLGIAQALLNEPQILLCDEPTSALDPIGRKEILAILKAIKGKTTVIFSTHILSDVDQICDHVAILHHGEIALAGELSEIKKTHQQNGFLIEFPTEPDAVSFERQEKTRDSSLKITREQTLLTIMTNEPKVVGPILLNSLLEANIVPLKFEVFKPTLESLFSEVVK